MIKIADMPDEVRNLIRKIIRVHCKKNRIYTEANKHGIGLEQTEEVIEKMLDDKSLVIETNEDKDNPSFRIVPGVEEL